LERNFDFVDAFVTADGIQDESIAGAEDMEVKMSLKLQSAAFKDGERIPDKYSCSGQNISPPLSWGQADTSIKYWCLIVEDPGAPSGAFTHWVIYNIPSIVTSLPEGLPATEKIQNGALQGKNDMRGIGYTGPCPPPGPAHYYNFHLFALDVMLNLASGKSKKDVQNAIRGHVISQGKLVGIYQSS
jgi:Raf kinase inhibitor-like YbhB/YbcL family protein